MQKINNRQLQARDFIYLKIPKFSLSYPLSLCPRTNNPTVPDITFFSILGMRFI